MRPLVLLMTASLDGFIAENDGGVDWLVTPPDDVPNDYRELMDSIDCLVMGSATYLVSLELAGSTELFAEHDVFVFTTRDDLPPFSGVTFVHEDAIAFTEELKMRPGGAIWLFGGGKLATAMSDAGLVDDYYIAVQPVLLGDGIPLWTTPHGRTQLELTSACAWPGGIAALRYSRSDRTP